MMNILNKNAILLVLCGATLCWSQNEDCIFDHDQVLNENGVEVSVSVRNAKKTVDDGYLNLNFNNGRFQNIPNIKAWCVDLGRRINTNDYEVDVLSSLDAEVTEVVYKDAVDNPEYLPSINWLFNNHPSGSVINVSDCAEVNHTISDQEFQLAVWHLVDDHSDPDRFWKSEEHQCIVAHLKKEASNHMDFEPDCTNFDSVIGLLVIVDDDASNVLKQTLVAEVKLLDTGVCTCSDPAAFGDPHFKTWNGEHYDFHGVCDLMLINSPGFENGLGIDIHVRTTKMRVWSYISSVAIRIGDDILEIIGGQGDKKFWINGVPGENKEIGIASNGMDSTSALSGFPISFKQSSEKQREFVIELGKGDKILVNTWNAFVGVYLKYANHDHFRNSVGLMGSFPQGLKLARDNTSVIDDIDKFGQEWQVLASEPKLFRNIEGPQHPSRCEIPSHSEMRRRLGESTITIEQAKEACTNVNIDILELCVFDVMATGDKFTVGAY